MESWEAGGWERRKYLERENAMGLLGGFGNGVGYSMVWGALVGPPREGMYLEHVPR